MTTPFNAQTAAFQQDIIDSFKTRTFAQTQVKYLSARGIGLSSTALSRQMVAETAVQASGITGEILQQIGLFYNEAVRSRRRTLETSYRDLGNQANLATVARYNREKGKGGAGSYRAGLGGKFGRDAGGKLGRALGSDRMFVAGPDGIAYINMAFLDSQARQWYRLNFGAGPRGIASQRPRNQRVVFFGEQTNLDVGLAGFGPSATFSMPAGLFSAGNQIVPFDPSRRGKDRFDPSSYLKGRPNNIARGTFANSKRMVTKGITAMNYLDAGTSVIARGMPAITTKFIQGILQESLASGGSKGAPAKAGLDTKDIERLLDRTSREVQALPKTARRFGSNLF